MQDVFGKLYGRAPHWIARAPGRVNLIGEHTDYNGGFVLPMAIDRYTEIAAAPNNSNTATLCSTAFDEILHIDLTKPIEPGPKSCWSNYPRGIIAGFMHAGYPLRGFDALIHSTVPLGGGLSSSASLEVALATLLEEVIEQRLDPLRKIDLCRQAEHEFARVPCGIMDQFVCTLGRENHLMLLDCKSQQPEWIEFSDPELSVLIVQTNVKHQLASGEYAARRMQCETVAEIIGVRHLRDGTREQLEWHRDVMDDTLYRRARHVLTESVRTQRAARAISARAWLEVGQLMYSSHDSLREDFEVSCRELDVVVEIAQNLGPRGGVYGCRMTGGGFGGCAVALIETAKQATIAAIIETEYKAYTGIEPALFISRPAAGATLVQGHS